MNHNDYVKLIYQAIPKYNKSSPFQSNNNKEQVISWADLGSGEGAFTLALVQLLPVESKIYSIDQNKASLQSQEAIFKRMSSLSTISFHTADFTRELPISEKLDGILMANSLHFVEEKVNVLKQLKKYLKPGGRLVIVEYNVDQGNHWVPYPFSFETFKTLVKEAGFINATFAGTAPSEFLNEMYCGLALNPS